MSNNTNHQKEAVILKGIASQILQMNVPNIGEVNKILVKFDLEIKTVTPEDKIKNFIVKGVNHVEW